MKVANVASTVSNAVATNKNAESQRISAQAQAANAGVDVPLKKAQLNEANVMSSLWGVLKSAVDGVRGHSARQVWDGVLKPGTGLTAPLNPSGSLGQ